MVNVIAKVLGNQYSREFKCSSIIQRHVLAFQVVVIESIVYSRPEPVTRGTRSRDREGESYWTVTPEKHMLVHTELISKSTVRACIM